MCKGKNLVMANIILTWQLKLGAKSVFSRLMKSLCRPVVIMFLLVKSLSVEKEHLR